MKTKMLFTAVVLPVCALFILTGCGSKSGVDESKPLSEVKAEAETMSVAQLKDTAQKYKDAITAKQPEIEKITAQLKAIPITETLGEEAKSLKADLEQLSSSLNSLKERFNIYYNKLVESKADVSDLQL